MSWSSPNYAKGGRNPHPHTPSPIPFRQMYITSPPHIVSSNFYVNFPATSSCNSPVLRLTPPCIPCPKPTRPAFFVGSSTATEIPPCGPPQYNGSSYFKPTQNYFHTENQLPSICLQTIASPPLIEYYYSESNDGRSTAEIIANQSQNYVDEKLAEYQATIFQLQGPFSHFIMNP